MKRLVFTILGTLFLLSVNAQKAFEKGDKYYNKKMYPEALTAYQKLLNDNQNKSIDKTNLYLKLAQTHQALFKYQKALEYFRKAENSKKLKAAHYQSYASLLMNMGEYDAAKKVYHKYAKASDNELMADYYKEMCNWAKNNIDQKKPYRISKTNINTGGISIGQVMQKDKLICSQASSGSEATGKTRYYDLYTLDRKNDTTFENPKLLSPHLNNRYYAGSPSFNTSSDQLYYTANSTQRTRYSEKKLAKGKYALSENGINRLQVFLSQKENGVWGEGEKLPFNSTQYDCAFPFISDDGKTLYFASNMPGGKGGYDLYLCKKENGKWSKPKNLGNKVNTPMDEIYPFILGHTFYFASKGHFNFGGLDIFHSKFKNGNLEQAKNMGSPINSPLDEFAFAPSKGEHNLLKGYYSSNRFADGRDDILYFEEFEYPDTIQCIARNKITSQPIEGIQISVFEEKTGEEVYSDKTNASGKTQLHLEKHKTFEITFTSEEYKPIEITIPAENRDDILAEFGNLDFNPIPKKDMVFEIRNIYFAYNKANIRPESYEILDKVVEYMKDNPDIKIELSAHTDSRGSDRYNEDLSQRRAQSTVNYLKEHGVKMKRMIAKGYGEEKLLNRCENGMECSEEKHQENRRVEIKVL